MRRIAACGYVVFLLALVAARAEAQSSTAHIDCVQGADCDAKWARGVAWIATNSTWRIAVATDTLVQTHGPDATDRTAMAYTMTRAPVSGDAWQITLKGGCANNGFACAQNFVQQVIAAQAAIRGE